MDRLLSELLWQEDDLQFNAFDSFSAWRVGSWIVKKARKEGLPIAVDITVSGRCLFHWSANQASVDNEAWIERKRKSVMRFGHSSLYLGRFLAAQGKSAAQKYYVDESEYAFHGGSFPLRLRGTGVVGTVTVSGLKQEDDHDLVVQSLRWILRKPHETPPVITTRDE